MLTTAVLLRCRFGSTLGSVDLAFVTAMFHAVNHNIAKMIGLTNYHVFVNIQTPQYFFWLLTRLILRFYVNFFCSFFFFHWDVLGFLKLLLFGQFFSSLSLVFFCSMPSAHFVIFFSSYNPGLCFIGYSFVLWTFSTDYLVNKKLVSFPLFPILRHCNPAPLIVASHCHCWIFFYYGCSYVSFCQWFKC